MYYKYINLDVYVIVIFKTNIQIYITKKEYNKLITLDFKATIKSAWRSVDKI
jgi:hypothetical protein